MAKKILLKQKIIVVDDSEDTRELLKTALEFAGYEVVTLDDGTEIVEKALQEQPDLMIIDLVMPRVDGFTATLRLRENPRTKDIPIIISTGRARLKDFFIPDELGKIQGFIEKPYQPEEIIEKVRKILGD